MTLTFAQELGVAVFILIAVAILAMVIHTLVQKRRAKKRASLVRSVRNHPAGSRALVPAPANTRPETPAYDWTSEAI